MLKRALEAGPELDVVYTRDAEEARRRVASGEFQAAFLLPPPRMEQLRAIALAGERMPDISVPPAVAIAHHLIKAFAEGAY